MNGAAVYESIEFEVSDHIATITLNRPEQLNAFTETMCNEMSDVWGIVRDAHDIHVAVLRANGERILFVSSAFFGGTGARRSPGRWCPGSLG